VQGIDQYTLQENKTSLDDLVRENAALVLKIAKKMKRKLPSHIEFDDLVQSGFIGLIEASKSYKQDQGASFATFAAIRIKGSIIDELRKNSWGNRETLKKMKELNLAVLTVEQRNKKQASSEEIAAELKISIDEYDKNCQSINVANMISMSQYSDYNFIESNEESPETIVIEEDNKNRIKEILEGLPERDRILLSLYYLEELTFKEIAQVLDLTEARVCQLHAIAIAKVARKI
jgi:RNA polymerase sigma factor for flagellar operon FliA